MGEVARVSPAEVREKLNSGKALFVCAYPDEERFKSMHLEGAISFREFESRLPSLLKDQEIIFCCARYQEARATGQAAQYLKMGYVNTKVLGGGGLRRGKRRAILLFRQNETYPAFFPFESEGSSADYFCGGSALLRFFPKSIITNRGI